MPIPIPQQIERIRREGDTLARAAELGPLDVRVPSCPDWDVEALVRHVGDVHRWAATIVRERVPQRLRRDFEPATAEDLFGWYREGVDALVVALSSASERDDFWYWGPAPNALSFWCRRQANETAIHRCDAQLARGAVSPLPTPEAVDGIDEWLGLAALRCHAAPGLGRAVGLELSDDGTRWSVVLDESVTVMGGAERADCAVRGAASDVFLWAMNRRGPDALAVSGDPSLLTVWSEHLRF